VQLREKDLAAARLFEIAAVLRRLTSDYGARLLINDRVDVAMAVDADGVHLGMSSLPVAEARRILGDKRLIGYSAHSVAEALQAQKDGADYVTLGPVFPTSSKAAYGEPLGVAALAEASCDMDIPVFALGGIKGSSVADVLSTGVHGIALISAIMAAPDPLLETESLLQTIARHAA
jgi:thiamine-phosphate pyrophosphorylase